MLKEYHKIETIYKRDDKTHKLIGKAKSEGLVARPKVELQDKQGNRIIVKIKVCDFVEQV